MKKLFQLMPLLAFSVIIFLSSCKKDDFPKLNNEIEYDGRTYDIEGGAVTFYGYYGDGLANVDLQLAVNSEEGIYFEMFIPGDEEDLIAGTYTYSFQKDEFTFGYGVLSLEFDSREGDHEIDETLEGTVKVGRSGNNYTITIDCTTDRGKRVRGKYDGRLTYYDESDYYKKSGSKHKAQK